MTAIKTVGLTGAAILLGLMMLTLPFISGCAGRKTTTETTSELRHDSEYPDSSVYDHRERESVEVTTTEQVTKEEAPRGFFGILGDIIALPFRAVGSVL